jgi:autoinducer 2 (AI-2) kinase
MINDWMTYRLCGELTAEPSNASESMLFDFRQRRWSEEILGLFEIPESVLPPVYAPGERIGAVSAEAAATTGLAAGTPVFMGGADTQCSLLGAGALEPGDVGVILGTTTPVQAVVGEPTLDPASNLWAGCHVVPERWVIEANVGASGDAYEWLLGLLVHGAEAEGRHVRAEEMMREATGGDTHLFIGPRIFDLTKIRPDLPGGIVFRFPAMQLRPSAGDLLRAFIESLAFAVRCNLSLLEPLTGGPAERLIAGGGMTRSRRLVQTLADVTGLGVRCATEAECTGLGVAILAAAGAGLHSDLASAAKAMCRHEDFAPDAETRGRYELGFAKWCELYNELDKLAI